MPLWLNWQSGCFVNSGLQVQLLSTALFRSASRALSAIPEEFSSPVLLVEKFLSITGRETNRPG
jgi:hypothetical protein